MSDAPNYGLRLATVEEFEAVRPRRSGEIYATCTDIDGVYGSPMMMTAWTADDGENPLCMMRTDGFEPGGNWRDGRHRYYVNPEFLPGGGK